MREEGAEGASKEAQARHEYKTLSFSLKKFSSSSLPNSHTTVERSVYQTSFQFFNKAIPDKYKLIIAQTSWRTLLSLCFMNKTSCSIGLRCSRTLRKPSAT